MHLHVHEPNRSRGIAPLPSNHPDGGLAVVLGDGSSRDYRSTAIAAGRSMTSVALAPTAADAASPASSAHGTCALSQLLAVTIRATRLRMIGPARSVNEAL
jgi:hypothetical protein